MNIGLATLWFKASFDSILESYALYKLIEALGHTPSLLAKPLGLESEAFEPDNKPLSPGRFLTDRCRITRDYKTPADYTKLNEDFDGFVVGGGSVWDYEESGGSGQYFYLDFAQGDKKKLAYAPTFGNDRVIAVDSLERADSLIKKFDGVAVENEELANKCARRFKVDPEIMLSPLLVCGKEVFEKLAEDVKLEEEGGGFIACDISANLESKYRIAQKAASLTGLAPRILLKPLAFDEDVIEALLDTKVLSSVEEYVGYLQCCDFLVTDSFTSMCLAILFEKPFVVLAEESEPDYENIYCLLNSLNLLKYIIRSDRSLPVEYADLFFERPDYKTIRKLVAQGRQINKKWLKNTLAGKKTGGLEPQRLKRKGLSKTSVDRSKYMIQKLLFPETGEMDEHWWMYYRGHKMLLDPHRKGWLLPNFGYIEFFTYFNSLSISKWMRYTNAKRFYLHLKIKGQFNVRFFGHSIEGQEIKKETLDLQHFDQKEISEIIIPVRTEKSSVVAFSIDALSDCEFYGGYYSVDVSDVELNPVELDIITTTFKKEDFVRNNVRQFEDELFIDDEIADHIFVNVIDNGRTLDAGEYESEHLKVFPNPNTGGAGGFTRGMLETLRSKRSTTHVLLMDDDVSVLAESIKRTYKLLRLMKEEYQDHFISGAMFFLDRMNIQYEDIGYVNTNLGAFFSVKPQLEMHLWDSVVRNEEDYVCSNQYASWWYCCIPIKFIREDNLPLPLFYRGDDIEFSLRNKAQIITMNGICVWHTDFAPKYSTALELWLVIRNSFFIQATSDIILEADFLKRMDLLFWEEIRRFHYAGANLLLDALEEFMQGPETFMKKGSEGAYLEHIRKNLEMLPIGQFEAVKQGLETDRNAVYHYQPLSKTGQWVYDVTVNGHRLPRFLLGKGIEAIPYDFETRPQKEFLRESLLAVNVFNQTASLRTMSKEEYKKTTKRHQRLVAEFRAHKDRILKEYRAASTTLQSAEFWEDHLELAEHGEKEGTQA
jgi:GT2 family glycosyltransferase